MASFASISNQCDEDLVDTGSTAFKLSHMLEQVQRADFEAWYSASGGAGEPTRRKARAQPRIDNAVSSMSVMSSSTQAPRPSPQPRLEKQESLMQQTRKALLGGSNVSNEKQIEVGDHGGSDARTVVQVRGVQRPIRLDTHDSETERLNSLVRDVKMVALSERNHEIAQRAKMASINAEVRRLQMERVALPLEVPDSTPPSWRAVNTQKPRYYPGNLLQYTLPEQRKQHLNAIERAALAAVEAEEVARRPAESTRGTPLALSPSAASAPPLPALSTASPQISAPSSARQAPVISNSIRSPKVQQRQRPPNKGRL